MSLRRKTILAIGIILAVLLGATYAAQQFILTESFANLEAREMRAHLTRALNALRVETTQLERVASDWARWDDTYQFIEDVNPAYIQSNLTDAAFTNLRLNVMVFIHSSGRIVSGKAYDLQNQRAVPLPPTLSAYLTRDSVLLQHPDLMSVTSGILNLPEGPLLVAALPILTSQNTGPSRGTLIFGRFLDAEEIAQLGETIQLSLTAQRWDNAALPADFETARARLTAATPVHTQPLDDQIIAGYALLNDVSARPALILGATIPRDITQQGRTNQIYLSALGALVSLVGCVLLIRGLDRLVLARLTRLARQIRHIGELGDATQRVQVGGSDELGALEREINRMLAAIPASEECFRALVEHSHDLILILDRDTTIRYASPTLQTMLGYTSDEVRGRSALEFIHPDDQALTRQALAHRLRHSGAADATMIVRARHRSGDYRAIELLGSNLLDNPVVRGIVINGHDITEQKRLERALRESEERWRTYIEQANDLIFALDPAGRIMLANRALCDALGYPAEEFIGKSPLEFLAPESRVAAQTALQRIFAGENIDRFEAVACTRAQQHLTLEVRGRAFRKNGKFTGTLYIARDITLQKQTEELLRQQEKQYRSLIENSSDLILLMNEYRMIRYVSPSIERMLGYAPADVIGADILEFTHPDERATWETELQRTLADPWTAHRVEHRLRHQDGSWRECETIAQVYHREYGIDIAINTRDITERKKMENELRRSRKEWQDIFNAIGHPTFILNSQHDVIAANPAVTKQLGKAEANVVGKKCYELFHNSNCAPHNCPMELLLRSGKTEAVEMEMQTASGTFLVSCTPVLDAQGNIEKIIHIATDVTALKEAQRALQESNARFFALVEGIPDIVYLKDLEGRNLYVNKAYEDFAGTTRANIIGKRDDEIMPPELAAACGASDAQVLQTDTTVRHEEYTTDRAGNMICYETIKSPIHDAQGQISGLVGVSRDVSERKRAEEKLRQSEARFRTLIEDAPIAISIGRDGKLLYVNPAYVQMYGFTHADELIGSAVVERVAPQSRDESFERSRLRARGAPVETQYELIGLRRDGTEFPLIATVTRVQLADGSANIGFFQDITERKRAEAQLRAYSEQLERMVDARTRELREAQDQLVRQERLATLGQLAGSVAHELRSPLSAIKNAAYYLKMCLENPSTDTREMMQILDEQVDVSARIIGSLLDFARPKTPTLQRAHLPAVIDAAARQCEMPKNVTLVWGVAENLPPVLIDAAQMQVVFRNLIANAIQAMPDGGELTIAVRQISDFRLQMADSQMASSTNQSESYNLQSAIEVRVSDTGVGIPADALAKIFQPLYTTKAKGIGLGLALCKMIVEAHGGTIAVESSVGKGTTFVIALPLETND